MRPDVLVMADRHIVESRKHIADQIRRIRVMERRGDDTTSSRELLATMKQSLAAHEAHRESILDSLARSVGPTIHV
jgi:hypothetical protein